jgi:hypothetical protein
MTEASQPSRLDAHYQKSNFFRVVHADGAFGGPSPRGLINIAFYSERAPIPRHTTIPIVGGIPGPEEISETKSGIFRELEVNVVMDLAVAVSLQSWLGQKIAEAQGQLGVSQETINKLRGGIGV